MRFGTSAIVRVGRSDVAVRGFRPAPAGLRPAPAQVRVGRDFMTRVGQNAPQAFVPDGQQMAMGANGPVIQQNGNGCASQFDWTNSCSRALGTGRVSIAAGATTQLQITTCGPARLNCLIIPESFALLFEITSLKVCRDEYITTPIPAEAFTSQGVYACLGLGCGSVFYASQPLLLSVHNISGAAAFFSALAHVNEMNVCS